MLGNREYFREIQQAAGPDYGTISEAAHLAQVSEATIRRWATLERIRYRWVQRGQRKFRLYHLGDAKQACVPKAKD